MGRSMLNSNYVLLLALVVLVLCVDDGVWAFGAGNIPSVCFLVLWLIANSCMLLRLP